MNFIVFHTSGNKNTITNLYFVRYINGASLKWMWCWSQGYIQIRNVPNTEVYIIHNCHCYQRNYRTLRLHVPFTCHFPYIHLVYKSLKGKFVPGHAMKVCRGSWGIAPLFLNLGTRWTLVVNFILRPLCSWERTPVSIALASGWPSQQVLTFWGK